MVEKAFVLASEEEMQVFGHRGDANSILINVASLPVAARDFFAHRNMQIHSNLRAFHASLVLDLLRLILPSILFDNNNNNNNNNNNSSSSSTIACSSTSKEGSAVLAFLPHFWRYVATREEIVSIIADGPALVPSVVYPSPPDHTPTMNSTEVAHDRDGQHVDLPLPPIVNLSPLSRMQGLIAPRKGDQQLPPHILTTLQRIGVRAIYPRLLSETVESGTICTGFWSYVCVPTRSGVIAAIDATIRTQARERKPIPSNTAGMMGVDGLTGEQRETLRVYLSTCESVAHLTDSECTILRGLPLYRICREDQGPVTEGKSDHDAKGYVSIGNRTRKGLGQRGSTTSSSGDVNVLFDASPDRPYCTLRLLDAPALSRGCVLFPPHLLTHTPSEPSDLALLERLGSLDTPLDMPHQHAPFFDNYIYIFIGIHSLNTPLNHTLLTHHFNPFSPSTPGVQILLRSEYFRIEMLSRLPLLLRSYPTETERALVLMLEEIKALCDEDDAFMPSLRETAFLTTAAPPGPGTSSGAGLAVYRACDLFDPQVDI